MLGTWKAPTYRIPCVDGGFLRGEGGRGFPGEDGRGSCRGVAAADHRRRAQFRDVFVHISSVHVRDIQVLLRWCLRVLRLRDAGRDNLPVEAAFDIARSADVERGARPRAKVALWGAARPESPVGRRRAYAACAQGPGLRERDGACADVASE